jgi:hypothetical protein
MVVFRLNQYNRVKDNGFIDFKLCGDWQLWIEIMHGHKIVSVPYKLNLCRRHENNVASKFTTQGLDFTEAVKVLQIGKKLCNNSFDRKHVYSIWLGRYYLFRNKFSKGILPGIFLNLLKYDFLMFIYFIYNLSYIKLRSKTKYFWRYCRNRLYHGSQISQ